MADVRLCDLRCERVRYPRFTRHRLDGCSTPLMNKARRRELARAVLSGYVSGPAAATEATARALGKVGDARAIVLVEGISDQIALETLAVRRGRDLDAEGVAILPMGGAHAITGYLTRFGPDGADVRLAGLCDAGDEGIFRRGLAEVRFGWPKTRADMERLGFYVCVQDLEDELIRAVGAVRVEALFDSQGDLGSFRTLQMQPGWRGRNVEAQMRRFLGSAPAANFATPVCSWGRWIQTAYRIRSTPYSQKFDHRQP